MNLKSNEPFWLTKNGLKQAYPSVSEDISTDIIIVGAGITGSLIAHQSIKDGYQTMVIDRRDVANGSTSATTSMLQYEIDVPLFKLKKQIGDEAAVESYRACLKAIKKLKKIIKESNASCGFEYKKSLYFSAYKKDVAWLKEEFETRKKEGFKVRWLEASQIEKKFEIKNSYGGILSKHGGSMEAFSLCHDLLHYNVEKGLKVFDKTTILDTKYEEDGVKILTGQNHTITAKKIIYCNGYESDEIIQEKFVDLLSTYALVSEQNEKLPKKLNKTLVWNTAQPYLYLRTTDDNRLLVGGEDVEFINGKKRDELIPYKTDKLEAKLKNLFPDFDFKTDYAWAGTFGETKDGLPYIGSHSEFKNALFVLGFGGNGIVFSVLGMKIISDLLKNKNNKLAHYFRFGR
ncbi:FAD-dependent oxidoreductase [Flavobacterium sp.]|uniref:NAD(P)/FAD-dependent oxidoreductase n=1 Tax=Flavobacterium sp. TaxID=239 RepID=UPI00260447A3|nr:FAD-dependent oxidoreductase [Flavobacterium sp.]MDD2986715.1 FAD-dependent oxidoreductase [Flavobacterium sp.]